MNDLYKLSIDDKVAQWEKIDVKGPAPRSGFHGVIFAKDGTENIVIFGGTDE